MDRTLADKLIQLLDSEDCALALHDLVSGRRLAGNHKYRKYVRAARRCFARQRSSERDHPVIGELMGAGISALRRLLAPKLARGIALPTPLQLNFSVLVIDGEPLVLTACRRAPAPRANGSPIEATLDTLTTLRIDHNELHLRQVAAERPLIG